MMTRRMFFFNRPLLWVVLLIALGPASWAAAASAEPSSGSSSYIVRYITGTSTQVEARVAGLGGTVQSHLPIIDCLVVTIRNDKIHHLRRSSGIVSVTPDTKVQLLHSVDGFDGSSYTSSMYNLNKSIRAEAFWNEGITGAGVDVALVDSGVVRVNGLSFPGKVIDGPDLSFESQAENLRYRDTFGHGTHMGGIIAGRDDQASTVANNHDDFIGVAPGSRLVSLKVADAQGATDISQVIAAINWVVEHRSSGNLNIRVLNLSFGTNSVQDYALDPLTYATEVAWRKGIVVVVAAGNSAFGSSRLNNPAYDPHVIAVGADDTKGTSPTLDDSVPSWSAVGDGGRNPDVLAPGVSVVALRTPGSYIDEVYPAGRVSPRFFRGSGTSQAAAFVSGAAALLLEERPLLTPAQVKQILKSTAVAVPNVSREVQGSGLIDLRGAKGASVPADTGASAPYSGGLGYLEGARGSAHVSIDGEQPLTGERDIHGVSWDASSWSRDSLGGTTWMEGTWRGTTWTGHRWEGDSWGAASWTGNTWTGRTWSSFNWSGNTWTGNTWTGNTWTGNTWTGNTWTGNTWTGNTWTEECGLTGCWRLALWPALWGV